MSKQLLEIKHVLPSQLAERLPAGYFQSVWELYSGSQRTSPSIGREEDWNPRPSDYKSNALSLGHVASEAKQCIRTLTFGLTTGVGRGVCVWGGGGGGRGIDLLFHVNSLNLMLIKSFQFLKQIFSVVTIINYNRQQNI